MRIATLLQLVIASLCGLLFGAGMIISDMVDPNKVIGFLNISGDWDPSLMFVMGGGLAVFAPLYHLFIKKRNNSISGDKLALPSNTNIDTNLIVGAVFFGAGWGLAGFCPGPAITSLSAGSTTILCFVASMSVGMWAAKNYLHHQRAS